MSNRVYKYPFGANDILTLKYRKVVMVAQDNVGDLFPTIWVEHGDGEREHHVSVRGTGHEIPGYLSHAGSCCCGPFVWHVYESDFDA